MLWRKDHGLWCHVKGSTSPPPRPPPLSGWVVCREKVEKPEAETWRALCWLESQRGRWRFIRGGGESPSGEDPLTGYSQHPPDQRQAWPLQHDGQGENLSCIFSRDAEGAGRASVPPRGIWGAHWRAHGSLWPGAGCAWWSGGSAPVRSKQGPSAEPTTRLFLRRGPRPQVSSQSAASEADRVPCSWDDKEMPPMLKDWGETEGMWAWAPDFSLSSLWSLSHA